MASSSKRSRSSKSKQGESTTKSNPLNLTRLLANDAQRKVFEENFHERAIFTPKYGNIGNFEFEDFLFPYLLRQQKLFNFCCEANDIYPELVRVFYYNMNFRKNLMTSHVKGKDIVLDMKTFSSLCCDIPMIGDITGFCLMIMDELVSLRGYITTRMDAFDTQSQQIHYKLYRLSSRLSNMDVDEDSSEPES
ncbi:hypothetical protein Lal_00037526 [Lupinus albus]|nr:hypothetical protein Lal_00037526 [Lupinus albus]